MRFLLFVVYQVNIVLYAWLTGKYVFGVIK